MVIRNSFRYGHWRAIVTWRMPMNRGCLGC